MLGSLIIIPNENKLHIDPYPYECDLLPGEHHVPKIKEFCNENDLGITDEMLGILKNDITGLQWQRKVASLGHVVIVIGYVITAFLPSKISTRQNEWFKNNKTIFKDEDIELYEYEQIDENGYVINKNSCDRDWFIVDSMYQLIEDSLELNESSDLKL